MSKCQQETEPDPMGKDRAPVADKEIAETAVDQGAKRI